VENGRITLEASRPYDPIEEDPFHMMDGWEPPASPIRQVIGQMPQGEENWDTLEVLDLNSTPLATINGRQSTPPSTASTPAIDPQTLGKALALSSPARGAIVQAVQD
jgi:hypothetical protein